MTDEKTEVVVVGAGVAGLSLAIMLARRNIKTRVLDARETFDGPTSGVRISAGGVKVLKTLGVTSIGEGTGKVDMRFGCISAQFTIPDQGASAIIVTRLALHEQLLAQARSAGVELTMGFRVARVAERADGVEVISESGEQVAGALVVGADGVGSAIRRMLNPNQGSTKRFAGYLGVGLITEDEAKLEMTLHHYPGHQVGIASCGKVKSSALEKSIFMWTHIRMSEEDAKRATRASVEAELTKRSALWSPELRSKYELYVSDPGASLSYGPVYNGTPPPCWYGNRVALIGDAAHPYGPGGQGISMALEDAEALCEVIARGFTTDDKREFQRAREREARSRGEAAEKRNARDQAASTWGVLAEGVVMKTVALVTGGRLRF